MSMRCSVLRRAAKAAAAAAVAAAACASSNSVGGRRAAMQPAAVTTLERGVANTHTWRLYYADGNAAAASPALVSPWHDLARCVRPTSAAAATAKTTRTLDADAYVFTYVNEIPRATRAKLEMATGEAHNPIAHDTITTVRNADNADVTGGTAPQLRYFAYGDCPFNYGFLPQTWESTQACVRALDAGCLPGDGDPLDVVLLGPAVAVGAVLSVRVLGVLALLDQGELDWKIIATTTATQGTSERGGDGRDVYTTLSQVPHGVCEDVVRWFREYKTAEGKPRNEYLFGARMLDAHAALDVIAQCAHEYDELCAGTLPQDGYWLPQQVCSNSSSSSSSGGTHGVCTASS